MSLWKKFTLAVALVAALFVSAPASAESLLYPSFKEALLNGDLDVCSALTIKVVGIDSADYTYDAGHNYLDDVPAGARVGTPQTLANRTCTGGVFDADPITFSGMTGDPFERLLLYVSRGGAESADELIGLIDIPVADSPVIPNGGDVTLSWAVAGYIFAL